MIDVSTFKTADSRWQDIFLHLESVGFDVYPPAVKIGECESKYIVIKNDGSTRHLGVSTDDDFYAIMCYVPKQAYSSLEPFVQQVKQSMKELEPMILPYGNQTPSYYDDSVKAHMISIQYVNYKKV